MTDVGTSERAKFDRWLLTSVFVLAVWGMAFGTWLEFLTNINSRIITFWGSGLVSVWLLRITDPKSSRQFLIVVAIGFGVIALTFLGSFGFMFLAASGPVRELGWLVTGSVRGVGTGLCFATCLYGSKWIYPRLGVALRDNVRSKG